MSFTSFAFAIFLPSTFLLYWFVFNRSVTWRNLFMVAISYVFYAWWDWRFLGLIIMSSMIDYTVGIYLGKSSSPKVRKSLLGVSLLANLGLLGFFKYYNFFAESLVHSLQLIGLSANISSLNIILPVGISFYTFQTLSYTIDIYRGKLQPTTNLLSFFGFVSFFPQLVAGPIERAKHLLPQFAQLHTFHYAAATDGMRQILWGLFKKMVIADNAAVYANMVFANPTEHTASSLALGVFLFSVQIYGDFSGYSDIAIGTARLFGFNLSQNFAFPYFSRNMAEFWRRWHISLLQWFRDYIYIPLGGSRGTMGKTIANTIIVFTISGLWHGANWTFVAWGLLNALYLIPLIVRQVPKFEQVVAYNRWLPSLRETGQMVVTFGLVNISWVLFRAESVSAAGHYLHRMVSWDIFSVPEMAPVPVLILIAGFTCVEWLGRRNQYAIESIQQVMPRPLRWLTYSGLIVLIGLFAQTAATPFIYFQF